MTETRMSLLQRMKNPNDGDSWQEFYELYAPLLASFVRKQGIRESSDVEDVVQDLLIHLSRRLPEFDLDKRVGRFRTYLWQAAHNAVVSWFRRTAKHQQTAQIDLDSRILELEQQSQTEPTEDFIRETQERVLSHALSRVKASTSESTWLCFEQHILKRNTATEVASRLGRTENSVYVNSARVLKRIRDVCQEYSELLGDDENV